ncbi:MAG: deoxyribose-phosphate aldolase [Desulfarculaceae bacterium]|nr:deoxyribose-phosphate aldolase [Desulfarculaceae bacterium]MCF8048404.1 deoxyribose-phosphate aldolase [Desulfarculaceae bacterium]MCF8064823.1 deoxyribose-phosphate aldolase [Desulfarculaceae bacterium]MCF8097108.1 deoxyribose-phosphate aldolase [Desulfarculaceae bacterium]MCF8122705.1 deoxyribose-phosphate aldolase [Desulfarculaceae bacterium]
MAMVKLKPVDNRFQADVWEQALSAEGVEYRLRTFQDTAYDGLYVSQKGYGVFYVEEEDKARAEELVAALGQEDTPGLDSASALAGLIEHTLLSPEAGEKELAAHLEQCREMGCMAACVSPWMVPLALSGLEGSGVAVCTVVGFPLGTQSLATKLAEAQELAAAGATELDMVLNRGLALGGGMGQAVDEAAQIAQAIAPARLKVILETSELGPEMSAQAAQALALSGAAFLKTGSGYFGPATVEDVNILADNGGGLGIKAAGGIKTLDDALALMEAGATRLGTSSGWDIYREAQERWSQED